jgi:hypothetical protein
LSQESQALPAATPSACPCPAGPKLGAPMSWQPTAGHTPRTSLSLQPHLEIGLPWCLAWVTPFHPIGALSLSQSSSSR